MNLLWVLGIDLNVPVWFVAILVLLTPFAAYYIYMTWHYNIFRSLGIPGPKPTPILGTLQGIFKGGFGGHDKELLEQYGDVVGSFIGRFPVLLIADPIIIRQILVKQFNNFANRTKAQFDELSTNMLHMASEDKWRNLRTTLSPTFSSGKLKKITKQINTSADQLVQHLELSSSDGTIIEFKEFADAFTMDVIASTAFGLNIDSKKETSNKFVEMANISMAKTLKSPLFIFLFFLPFMIPFMEKLGFQMFPKEGTAFFKNITEQIMADRNKYSQKQIDFVQLMLNAHKDELTEPNQDEHDKEISEQKLINGKKKPLTKVEILANAVIFFLAGHETTANTLSFIVHLLAVNPDCQKQLQKEVDEICQDQDPKYEDLQTLPYLDKVVDETLRLYPQSPRLDRVAKDDVVINGIKIPKGTWVAMPVKYLHYNCKYWKDPETFDPERFSPEEKSKRDPYCYLPFGHGPRNCIGMRLALVELKIAVIKLIQKYEIDQCSRTQNSNIKLTSRFFLPDINQSVMVKNLDATHLGFPPFQTGLYQIPLKSAKMRSSPDGGVYVTLRPRT